LTLSGVFDQFPDLSVIVGYWGELVLFYLDRIDYLTSAVQLDRSLSDCGRTTMWTVPSRWAGLTTKSARRGRFLAPSSQCKRH